MKVTRLDFEATVYSIVKQIPSGKVLTYGIVATLAGYPGRSRMVGRTMRHSPLNSEIPYHRVVSSDGRTAPCCPEQNSLLTVEGVEFRRNGRVDMKKYLWQPE